MKRCLLPLFASLLVLPVSSHAEDTTATTTTPQAFKTDREVLDIFYQLLNNTGTDLGLSEGAEQVIAKNWKAEPPTLGGNDRDGFVRTFMRYHQAIPDMLFTPQEILSVGKHRYVVRSIASGTVISDFLDLGDKFKPYFQFNVMTIEIHTIKNGKLIKTYHVEDWKTAIAQSIAQRQ